MKKKFGMLNFSCNFVASLNLNSFSMSNTLAVHSFAVVSRHSATLALLCGCTSPSVLQSLETRVAVGVYPPPFLSGFKVALAAFDHFVCPDGFYALKRKICTFFKMLKFLT